MQGEMVVNIDSVIFKLFFSVIAGERYCNFIFYLEEYS